MMGLWFLGPLLVIAVVVYLIGMRPQIVQDLFPGVGSKKSPLEILEERYARGEINKEEFDQMQEDLS